MQGEGDDPGTVSHSVRDFQDNKVEEDIEDT